MEETIGERIKESFTWLSVQVTALWGMAWVIYSQLPAEVMDLLNHTKIWLLSVPAWMGVGQSITTYMARMRKKPQ